MENNKNVIVLSHPVIEHNLSILRDKNTDSERFRTAVRRVGVFLSVEATKKLPLRDCEIETPLQKMTAKELNPNYEVVIIPILRAGLIFCETMSDFIPDATIAHIGMYRNEDTKQPIWYLDKTKKNYQTDKTKIFLLDPMLATGNSAKSVIKLLTRKKIKQENITFISLISAWPGIQNIHKDYPDVSIITASIDIGLNEKTYIVPGLGDAGDRMFHTVQ